MIQIKTIVRKNAGIIMSIMSCNCNRRANPTILVHVPSVNIFKKTCNRNDFLINIIAKWS